MNFFIFYVGKVGFFVFVNNVFYFKVEKIFEFIFLNEEMYSGLFM